MSQELQFAALVLGVINLMAVAISLILAYKQLRKAHEWNRRKASQDLLFQMVSGDVLQMRVTLEQRFGARPFNQEQHFDDVLSGLPEEERRVVHFTARNLLNYYETVAIGIKNSVLEDDICFDFLQDVLRAYWRWASPLTKEHRTLTPLTWIELEYLNQAWSERARVNLERQKNQTRVPGRART